MSDHHSTVNVKNYQFLYPSVAVWQDFNDLDLKDSKRKQEKRGKSKSRGKAASGLFQAGFDKEKDRKSGKMKRYCLPKITNGCMLLCIITHSTLP